jgi:hypothetical protein
MGQPPSDDNNNSVNNNKKQRLCIFHTCKEPRLQQSSVGIEEIDSSACVTHWLVLGTTSHRATDSLHVIESGVKRLLALEFWLPLLVLIGHPLPNLINDLGRL